MAASLDSFRDLEELGIDCEDDSLTEKFHKAANHLQTLVANLDNQTLLTLYGYYKQGSLGPCSTPKPSWYDLKAKSKWEAWNKLGDLSQSEAKTRYIETVKKLDPNFEFSKESWVSVSTLQNHRDQIEDKSVFDYVKEENCEQVRKCLEETKWVEALDENGMGLIHWASDRGSRDILKVLVDAGADVNLQDSEGQTALHYASSCGHIDCIKFLMESKARVDVRDGDGSRPEDVAADSTVKELLACL